MARLPLEGLRVVDLTVVWAGPFAAALLSDMGAEVIKVESIQRWDANNRSMAPPVQETLAHSPGARRDAKQWEASSNFNTVFRNRKSVTMDLTRPEGIEAFRRLIAVSDVFIENNSPEVVRRLGLTWEQLQQVNPRLIMLSMAAFGSTGPYRSYRAYGANMEAVVGHALLRGYADMDPTANTNVFFADACGGAAGAFAVLAALHHRNRSGKGQYIDMAQAENVAHTFSQAYMDYSMNGRVQRTLGNRHPSRAPQGVYPCAGEDRWLALSCASDEEFRALCRIMARPQLAFDERFRDSLSRRRNHDALDEMISAWSATQDVDEAFHALQAAGVAATPVMNVADVYEDSQLRERDMWQEVTHPWVGSHAYFKPPISHMSETPLRYWRHAPTLGQDNEYVYRELLGYSDAEYQWFVDNQHAGTTFLRDAPSSGLPPAPSRPASGD